MIIGLMFMGGVILIGIFVLVFVIGGYNALVTLRNPYKNAYCKLMFNLKRRYNLIPNLVETENKISFARQAYNDAVMTYNTRREVFPTNFIANTFNFGPAELFVIEKPEQKEAPKVAF